jgi:hypothetical protein
MFRDESLDNEDSPKQGKSNRPPKVYNALSALNAIQAL